MTQTIDFSALTLKDAFDLAICIEEEARQRYVDFAAQLGRRYKGDASDFFEVMAGNEAKHAEQLLAERVQRFGSAARTVSPDLISDVEAPGFETPRAFMSPRQAMHVALAAEIKAYDFYNQALSLTTDAEVVALFTELREEEQEHRAMLEQRIAALPDDDGAAPEEDTDDIPQL